MAPTLPVELIQSIVKLALDAACASRSFEAEYDLLRTLSVVSLTFRDVAQPLLFKRVWLNSTAATRAFNRSLKGRLNHLAPRVDELSVGASNFGRDEREWLSARKLGRLELAAKRCVNLRKATLSDVRLNARGLFPFRRCAELELSHVTLDPINQKSLWLTSNQPNPLKVAKLVLDAPEPNPHWASLLNPKLVPSLTSLSVDSEYQLDELPLGHYSSFEGSLWTIAPRLVEFRSAGESDLTGICSDAGVWPRFTSLRHLAIVAQEIGRVLELVPTKLETLRVDCLIYTEDEPISEMHKLTLAVEAGVRSVSELRSLTVANSPDEYAVEGEDDDEFVRVQSELLRVCRQRRIELKLVEFGSEDELS